MLLFNNLGAYFACSYDVDTLGQMRSRDNSTAVDKGRSNQCTCGIVNLGCTLSTGHNDVTAFYADGDIGSGNRSHT